MDYFQALVFVVLHLIQLKYVLFYSTYLICENEDAGLNIPRKENEKPPVYYKTYHKINNIQFEFICQ